MYWCSMYLILLRSMEIYSSLAIRVSHYANKFDKISISHVYHKGVEKLNDDERYFHSSNKWDVDTDMLADQYKLGTMKKYKREKCKYK